MTPTAGYPSLPSPPLMNKGYLVELDSSTTRVLCTIDQVWTICYAKYLADLSVIPWIS